MELGGEFSRQMGAEGTVEVVEAHGGVGVYCDGHSGCKELWGGGEGRWGVQGFHCWDLKVKGVRDFRGMQ